MSRTVAHKYPGLFRNVETYLGERVEEVLAGASGSIVVRIYGQDLDVLHDKAVEVRESLSHIEGIQDLFVDLQEKVPQIDVTTNLASCPEIRSEARRCAPGRGHPDCRDGSRRCVQAGRAYDVQVWGTPNTRNDVASIGDLLIDTPDGGPVALKEVADVSVKPSPNIITRENFRRWIDVTANASGSDLSRVAGEVKDRLAQIKFPLQYNAEVLGEYTEAQAAQRQVILYSGIAAIGILILLQIVFASWRLAFLAFITLPSAVIGGVLAAYLGDPVISIGSIVGFVTVFGIAARNVILLVHHCQHLEKYENEPFGPGLVIRAAKERLAPILMTTAATGLALIPLVVQGDISGQEIVLPTAIVILEASSPRRCSRSSWCRPGICALASQLRRKASQPPLLMAPPKGTRRQFTPSRKTNASSSDTKSPGSPFSPNFSSESEFVEEHDETFGLNRQCIGDAPFHPEPGDAAEHRHVLGTELCIFRFLVQAEIGREPGGTAGHIEQQIVVGITGPSPHCCEEVGVECHGVFGNPELRWRVVPVDRRDIALDAKHVGAELPVHADLTTAEDSEIAHIAKIDRFVGLGIGVVHAFRVRGAPAEIRAHIQAAPIIAAVLDEPGSLDGAGRLTRPPIGTEPHHQSLVEAGKVTLVAVRQIGKAGVVKEIEEQRLCPEGQIRPVTPFDTAADHRAHRRDILARSRSDDRRIRHRETPGRR